MEKNYKDFVSEIFGSKEYFLKDIFSCLFLEIHSSIKEQVETYDVAFINDLKGFPDELDFNKTLRSFNYKHFSNDQIKDILGKSSAFKFSVGDLRRIFDSPSMERSSQRTRLKSYFEQDFKIINFEEWARIADNLIFWRNKASHRGGIRNVSQAMAIYSEISLILKTLPRYIEDKIDNLDTYQEFLDEHFFASIIEGSNYSFLKDSQIAESEVVLESTVDEVIKEALEFENLQNSIEELSKKSEKTFTLYEKLEKAITQIGVAINQTNLFLSNADKRPLSSKILDIGEQKDSAKAEELVSEIEDVPENEDLIPEPIPNTAWDLESLESGDLTDKELKDKLLLIRSNIYSEMTDKYSSFKHWHNICQEKLIDELLAIRPRTIEEFKENHLFKYYYESQQMPRKILKRLSESDYIALKEEAKSFFEEQIEKYWKDIQSVISSSTQSKMSGYDLRRVVLFTGLQSFPARLKSHNIENVKKLIKEFVDLNDEQRQLRKNEGILLCSLGEIVSEETQEERRTFLKKVSMNKESNYGEESLFAHFQRILQEAENETRVEYHSIAPGSKKFKPLKLLGTLFSFNISDFNESEFGDHGWERLPPMSPRKTKVMEQIQSLNKMPLVEIIEYLNNIELDDD